MQAIRIKKITFLLVFLVASTQMLLAQGVSISLQKADSLFSLQRYREATQLYEKSVVRLPSVSPTILLKMANAYEALNDYPRTLYYLDLYYQQSPTEQVVKKMSQLASENGYVGYELNDFNFIVLLFKQYSTYLFIILLVVAIYVFSILLVKRIKNQPSPLRHHIFLLAFLIGCAMLINLPDSYQSGIVKRDGVYLRSEPSAGAEVKQIIGSGHRLSVIGSDDIWLRVLWENELMYIKRYDVMLTQ